MEQPTGTKSPSTSLRTRRPQASKPSSGSGPGRSGATTRCPAASSAARCPPHMRASSGKACRRRTVGRAKAVRCYRAMPSRLAPARPPVVAGEAMVATSQPLATRAGLRTFERGGNAVDAAVAASAVLTVTEPMSTGVGADAFALWWTGRDVVGLDAAGPAPRSADPDAPVAERGPTSVTVPGAVAGWAALVEEHGALGLDTLLSDAIAAAEDGFAVGAVTAGDWAEAEVPPELGSRPAVGERVRLPELGATLRHIAEDGADGLYRGEIARAIASSTWLDEEDLAAYAPRWVEPLSLAYRGFTVHELGPPTQGVAALEGLGLLALGEPTLAAQVECVRLALEDALAHVRDGADVGELLKAGALARRRLQTARPVAEPGGGTVYLCAADRGCDPQAALDRPRFRVEGEDVLLEEGLWERAGELEALGLRPFASRERSRFGGGQAILVEGDVLVGGSDGRKDGYAAGF